MAYTKRYAGGFVDLPAQTTKVDAAFLNAVEAALLLLISQDASTIGQVPAWNGTKFLPKLITNAEIDPAAAIAKTKLAALAIVDADVAGGAAIAGSKLANVPPSKITGYPADASKYLDGSANWSVPSPSAKAATAVSGLGAGSDGVLAKLRILPTTTSVGAQVLPVGTINVVDTSQLPSAGVVSTPNGDLTYTAKTATALTGVTGGAGTLAAGSTVTYKSGAYTTPNFDILGLMYDSTLGKWVSPVNEFVFNTGVSISSAAFTDTQAIGTSVATQKVVPILRLRDYVNAGLSLQARFTYWGFSLAASGQAQATYSVEDAHAVESARTAIAAALVTFDTGAANTYKAYDTGWCDLSAVTIKDFITFSAQAKGDGTNATTLANMFVQTRWVG